MMCTHRGFKLDIMIYIIYIICVIISFVLSWVTHTHTGNSWNWRNITIGELCITVVMSLLPGINIALIIISIIVLIEDGMFDNIFNIKPFKKKNETN